MQEESLLVLKEKFYNKLLENITNNHSGIDSILIKLLRGKLNSNLDLLDSSAVTNDEIDKKIINELVDNGLIRYGSQFSKYVITAKGVWEIESSLERIDIGKLLDAIDDYKFDIKWGGKLSGKEKVVLLSLIAMRAFSEKTPLNRDNGDKAKENIYYILKNSTVFLGNNVKSFKYSLPQKTRESTVDAVFARLQSLPENTRGIYKLSDNKSWLDIYLPETNKIDEEKLSYILWKIFGDNLDFDQQNKIDSFCNRILYEYKNSIYNSDERKKFVFSDITYQNIISNALFKIAEESVRWEELDNIKKKK